MSVTPLSIENQDRLALLAARSPDVLCAHAADGTIRWVSPAVERLLGRTPAELVGRPRWDFIHADDRDRIRAALDEHRRLRPTEELRLRYRYVRRDGDVTWVELATFGVLDPLGRFEEFLGVKRDVTELVRAASEREATALRYRAVLQSYPAGSIAMFDRELRYLVAEGAGLARAGLTSSDLVGRHIADVWPADHVARIEPQYRAALAGEDVELDVEFAGLTYYTRAVPIRDERGTIVAGLVHTIDITDRRAIEAVLEHDRERQRRVIEELPAIAYVCDLRTNANVHVSREFFRTLGFTAEEVRGHGDRLLQEAFHPDDVPAILEHASGWPVTADGEVRETRFRMRHREGGWRWLRTRELVYMRDPAGAPTHIIGFAVDETAERAAYDALVEQQQQLDYAQAIANMGSWEWDPASGAITWSRQMYRLWQRDPALPALDFPALLATIPAEERDAFAATLERALAERRPSFELTHALERPDGTRISCHCRGVVDYDEDGRPVRVAGTTQDVTEARRILDELRESEERYRLAQAASDDVMFDYVVGGAHRVLWNEAMRDVFGHDLSADGWTTDARWWQRLLHPDDATECLASLDTALHGDGPAWTSEHRFRRADGQYVVAAIRARILRGADGRATRVIGTIRDATARRAMEQRMRQAQKLDAIGTLAGGIAHDFNNILSAILGFSELAAEASVDAEVSEYAREVIAAAQRGRELVRQILTFSRQDEARREVVDLVAVVGEVQRLLRATVPAGIELAVTLPADAPPCLVLGDATQLHQVLLNLCTNAEHAMRAASAGTLGIALEPVRVPAGTHAGLAAGDYARLRVSDTGHGMPRHVVERVFEPFFTTKPVGEGTGMGLAVVHGIVSAMGGSVDIESTEGVGTTVTLHLPLRHAPGASGSHRAVRPAAGEAGRVVLVDDEAPIRRMLQVGLERRGWTVIACATPGEALAEVRRQGHRLDAIIADQTMPQMTGDLLLEAVHALRPDLPALLMTGFSHRLSPERIAELGATLLPKPAELDTVARTLAETVAARRTTTPTAETTTGKAAGPAGTARASVPIG